MDECEVNILERLEKHLHRVAKKLISDFEQAAEKHTGTPEAVAHARELSLRKTIERFFPFPYRVTKGAIYDSFNRRSSSIDCVICAPNHPLFPDENGNIEIILVDGTHAAIELKPDLTDLPNDFGANRQRQKPEIIRGLEQIRTVKRLMRTCSSIPRYKSSPEIIDYSMRCPAYIVSQKTRDIGELCKYIGDYYMLNNVPVNEQVDVVLALENGLIINNKCPDHSFTRIKESDAWTPHMVAYAYSQKFFMFFLLRLVSEIGPETYISEPVLARYLRKIDVIAGSPLICIYKFIPKN